MSLDHLIEWEAVAYIYKPEGNCTWHVRLAFYLLDELYLTATLQMYMRELYFLTIL